MNHLHLRPLRPAFPNFTLESRAYEWQEGDKHGSLHAVTGRPPLTIFELEAYPPSYRDGYRRAYRRALRYCQPCSNL